jgi:dTDP-4-amino-4,6-dideoxygalactose transaminase
MSAFASTLAILRSGATPVFADIDPSTALLDLDSVSRCITPRTKAVLLVHLYGQVRNMDRWQALCAEHSIHLLEDCAQSHLAAWQGKYGGSFGAWGAYSFYPTKNLGAIGDAGAFVTNNEQHAERARRLRNYGQSQRYHHPEIGMNSRLDEMQAAILRVRLGMLPTFTRRRREIAAMYLVGLRCGPVEVLANPVDPDSHAYHLFVVRCIERDRLSAHLKNCGIESLCHYPIPLHLQEPCRSLSRDPEGLPHTERHAKQCLSLPCHPQLTDDDVAKVIAAVNAFR